MGQALNRKRTGGRTNILPEQARAGGNPIPDDNPAQMFYQRLRKSLLQPEDPAVSGGGPIDPVGDPLGTPVDSTTLSASTNPRPFGQGTK